MISAVVATYGNRFVWDPLAERAVGSLMAQSRRPCEIIREHGSTLAEARNAPAGRAVGEWLLFLDADDTLDWRYVEAMSSAIEELTPAERQVTLLQPATLGVHPDGSEDEEAVVIPERDLTTSNFLVIGTVMPRSLFEAVGGFEEWPVLEDWALMLSMHLSGARHVPVPGAVYRVTVRADSRNNESASLHNQTYAEIRRRYLGGVR